MFKTTLQLLASMSAVLATALTVYGMSLIVGDAKNSIEQAGNRLAAFAVLGYAVQLAIVLAVSATGLAFYELDARRRSDERQRWAEHEDEDEYEEA